MKRIQRITTLVLIGVLGSALTTAQDAGSNKAANEKTTGILLLAHGGKQNWNDEVAKVAAVVNQKMPVEVAFGMAAKRNIQDAIDRLAARGVGRILAVPLFVSSHSSVITSTEYLLGQRNNAPPALAIFAKMTHGHEANHSSHGADASFDPTTPVKSPVPIQMLPALNAHPLVADILLSRATALSRQPENEVVVIVAHGPVSDEENNRWLADMRVLTDKMRGKSRFKRIEYMTVRDDAPEPIRSKATAELRSLVQRVLDENSRVLIVPLLLSYGGIEEGIKKRLEGLTYTMSNQALLPDDRLTQWVFQSAHGSISNK
jgi:sirohydrochlorin ferrochelatase